MLLYKADGKFTSQHNKLIKLLLQYNKIQYNSLLTPLVGLVSDNARQIKETN